MTQVVVVGAGVAGMAAAAALREAGLDPVVLEAADRVGGRAWTTRPAALGGAAFDHGAAWLHAAGRNPLVPLARAAGAVLHDSDAEATDITRRNAASATPADHAAYAAAAAAFERLAAAALPGADTSLAAAIAPAAGLPWMASVVNWEAPIIAAADADALSLRDWHVNRLEGPDLTIEGGLGAFVATLAGPVRLHTPVTAIVWNGGGVAVETPDGTIHAAACIVTVSTGVLAAGVIRFAPRLPDAVLAAVDGLPMGQVNKVALRAAGPGRLGLPPSCSVEGFIPHLGDPAMAFVAWPRGQDHVIGFMGGSAAGALPAAEAEDFARAQLRALFGAQADAAFTREAVVTQWSADPFSRGAYAYARPGHAGARAALAEPLAGGRLVFAGEATRTDGLAGTVGGAWLSGRDAAALVRACVAG